MWRLNNAPSQPLGQRQENFKIFQDKNNKNRTYENLWDAA